MLTAVCLLPLSIPYIRNFKANLSGTHGEHYRNKITKGDRSCITHSAK
jgi:hypothetical protein